MLTCLCDAFYGEVGIAAVKVLEHLGCKVEFPLDQTCCGQPPFNNGDWESARKLAARTIELFSGDVPVVVPSSSCAAMLRDGCRSLFGKAMSNVFELSEFVLNVLKIESWPGDSIQAQRVAFHRACHGRVLGLGDSQERLLQMVPNLRLVPFEDADQCCGFGGAFAIGQGFLSSKIGLEKLRRICETGVETFASGDMGCLMHLRGLIEKHRLPVRAVHYCQVLSSTIS